MPSVSVVVPSYNAADSLPRTIESALNQTFDDLEVIIVDDASTDDTPEVVSQYTDSRLRYYRHDENRGGSAARNTGIEQANGEYIAFLDADDEWLPSKVERQYTCLETRSESWVAAYCNFHRQRFGWHAKLIDLLQQFSIDPEKTSKKEGGEELIKDILLIDFYFGGSSTLFVRTDAVRSIQGFDESFPRHQDLEFLIRLLREGKIAYVDEDLVIKYESGVPSPSDVKEAKSKFFSKFSDEIAEIEDPVRKIHRFNLARLHYRNGDFKKGTRYLYDSRPPVRRDYVFLIWSILNGLRNL